MDDNTKKNLLAVGVGVGATAAIATAMYFLGGREAPKVPSFGDVTGFAKREIGFGCVDTSGLPEKLREYHASMDVIRIEKSEDGTRVRICAKKPGGVEKDYQWVYVDLPSGAEWMLTRTTRAFPG